MDVIKSDVRKLVNKELNAANKRFRPFASPHEGQNIVREELQEIREMAVSLAVETIQVAAMVKKFEHGQHRGWPGGKENWHGTEKKVAPGGCGNRNHNNEPENGGSGKASV